MGPFGAPELLLVLVIVLIVFGAGKLPQVFGSLGKGVKEFREASEGPDNTTTTPPATPTTITAPTVPTDASIEQEVQKVHDTIIKS